MKAIFGFGFFLLFLAGIAFVMLQGRQLAVKNLGGGGVGITGSDWKPTYAGAESMPEDSGMFVQFAVDGSIKGHGGCNAFTGTLETSDAGVAVGPLGATRMACTDAIMRREVAFMEALQEMRRFEASNDRLHLLDGDGQQLAELVRGD